MKINKLIAPGVVGLAMVAGVAGGSALNAAGASADTATTKAATTNTAVEATTIAATTTATDAADTSTASTPAQRDESKGGHTANGLTETLLTGDTATKATAAAQAAVPGGTIQRVENDAEGATYEAHVQKSDGSQVTVKMDASFNVTGTESGPGGAKARSSTTN